MAMKIDFLDQLALPNDDSVQNKANAALLQ